MSRLPASLLALALGFILLPACGEDEQWIETVSSGPVSYELTAGVPLDLTVLAEIDASGLDCGALYRTLFGEAVQDAPGVSIAVVIDGNVDPTLVDPMAGDRVQLGDAWNFVDRPGGGCVAETGLQLLSETDQTVELIFETTGQEGGPSGNNPGAGVFTVAIDPS